MLPLSIPMSCTYKVFVRYLEILYRKTKVPVIKFNSFADDEINETLTMKVLVRGINM